MGAWGPKSFENDAALDWMGDLLESKDPSLISQVFKQILAYDGTRKKYFLGVCIKCWQVQLPASMGEKTLAAGEIVSAIFGQPPHELPKSVEEWLETGIHMPKEVLEMAREAVAKIHTSSELKDFWEEDGVAHARPWHEVVVDLEHRLAQIANGQPNATDPIETKDK